MKTTASPEVVAEVMDATKWAQIIALVRENQLATALGLFVLWQTGVLLTLYGEVGGAICG
jgi:hypothetical protein